MTNIIFYTLLLSISTSFGLGAMKYSTINRTFMLLQRSVFEYAVITIDENGLDDVLAGREPKPYVKHIKDFTFRY